METILYNVTEGVCGEDIANKTANQMSIVVHNDRRNIIANDKTCNIV